MDSIIIFAAKYFIIVVILVFVYVWLRLSADKRKKMAAMVIAAGILALIIAKIAGKLYYDPRPFVSHNVKPLIAHAADNGFPSDHSLLAMALTVVLYFYSRKWAGVALALTILIGLARVLAHIHSPIDILGAWLISLAAGLAIRYLMQQLEWFSPAKKDSDS